MEVETKTPEDTELHIKRAMRARLKDFKEQADSLTLEGVRRALEKDLGMKTFSLDAHKRFIKQCLEEYLVVNQVQMVQMLKADFEKY